MTEESIRTILSTIPYPGFKRDIVSFGVVKAIEITPESITLSISLATKDPNIPATIDQHIKDAFKKAKITQELKIQYDIKAPESAQNPEQKSAQISGVKQIIAVGSGKGGVGKSTVSSNLAAALSLEGYKVGICDCDLYGPSMALMLGTEERPLANDQNEIIPVEKHGIKMMSMGLLLDDNSPVIVRGPLATRYIQQFIGQVRWGELDYLILDLPPGTGDIQLTIVQTISVTGAIIVTTPQEVALIDARKAISMFQKVQIPVLGLIENMSYFLSPSDGIKYHIFGEQGGQKEASRLSIPFLGSLPIEIAVREAGDQGMPIVLKDQAQRGKYQEIIANFTKKT